MSPTNGYREEDDASMTVMDRLLQQTVRVGDVVVRSRDPLRESIGRDLEVLLNTRREDKMIPVEFGEVATSILNFGVPEYTRFGNLSSSNEQNKFCRSLEEAISTFEPRLRKVSVRPIEPGKSKAGMQFRLEAIIDVLSERQVWEMGFMRDTGLMSMVQGG